MLYSKRTKEELKEGHKIVLERETLYITSIDYRRKIIHVYNEIKDVSFPTYARAIDAEFI